MTHIAFGQKHDKWILIKGKVVDTFGYSIANKPIALISKNGTDKQIKYTDSLGQFYFKLKKKNIDKYALRCYFFGNFNLNKLLSVNDFVKTDEYIVGTNVFNFTSKKYCFSKPHFGIYSVLRCELSALKSSSFSMRDDKYWRNLPVDQTNPAEILKSQCSFVK